MPIGDRLLLKVLISSMIMFIPSGVLKSAVGMLCKTTLCQGSSFWADSKGSICSQIDFFSRRKSAENSRVVVITTFWPRDFATVATTGSLTPLSRKALLNAFLMAKGEKFAVVLPVDD